MIWREHRRLQWRLDSLSIRPLLCSCQLKYIRVRFTWPNPIQSRMEPHSVSQTRQSWIHRNELREEIQSVAMQNLKSQSHPTKRRSLSDPSKRAPLTRRMSYLNPGDWNQVAGLQTKTRQVRDPIRLYRQAPVLECSEHGVIGPRNRVIFAS